MRREDASLFFRLVSYRYRRGTVDTTGLAPTTTIFEADDITEATNDHYSGRILIFTSGNHQDQASDSTDHRQNVTSSNAQFTLTDLSEASGNNDIFVMV